jgi:hypothetical protein
MIVSLAAMFSLFKRKAPDPPREPTFKTRVTQFWEWYSSVADRFYQTIESKRCGDLATEVSEKIDELIPGFAWVFGPGAEGVGHSFTLSGEGDAHRQLLAAFWLRLAPALPGWTFYASRQPSQEPGLGHIKIGDDDFDPVAFWLTPEVSEEREEIDLTVWHPLFPKLDDRTRWTVLFLFLDEALGEVGTQNWIGMIDMNDEKLADAIPLGELRPFTERVQAGKKWQKGDPGEFWTLYRIQGEHRNEPRGDIRVGSTTVEPLINEFAEAKGKLPDPLPNTGADYVYIAFDATILPEGREVHARGKIEDTLSAQLEQSKRGQLIGRALGDRHAYVDLLLFDGARSMALVVETLNRLNLPAGTSINYFAHEKRGQRVVL